MASSDYRSVRPRLTIYVCQEQPSSTALQGQPQAAGSGGESGGGTPSVYHAIYLEEMVASEVARKLASVFNIPFHQINQVYRQGPTGIHILVSDQMVQNFQDETCFLFSTVKAENNDGIHIILKWYLKRTELYPVPNKVMLKSVWRLNPRSLGIGFYCEMFHIENTRWPS